MIDLFYPPKPYELANREPSFIHVCYDDEEPKSVRVFKQSEEVRRKRRIRLQAWRARRRDLHPAS